VIVVADTTPLLYLSRIGQLELLRALYQQIVVPETVWREAVVARPDAVGVESLRAAAWIVDTAMTIIKTASITLSGPETLSYSAVPAPFESVSDRQQGHPRRVGPDAEALSVAALAAITG
jgi:hypothetical protein